MNVFDEFTRVETAFLERMFREGRVLALAVCNRPV